MTWVEGAPSRSLTRMVSPNLVADQVEPAVQLRVGLEGGFDAGGVGRRQAAGGVPRQQVIGEAALVADLGHGHPLSTPAACSISESFLRA